MGAHYMSFDRAQKFTASVEQERRNPDLRVLSIKGFDVLAVTLTPDQLKQIAEAISAETGGSDSPF